MKEAKEPLLTAARRAWDAHTKSLPEGVHVTEQGPESAKLEEEARRLEALLQAALKPLVDQYLEGLVSPSDFVVQLAIESGTVDY